MSNLKNLFTQLAPKTLNSAKERAGMRVRSIMPSEDILGLKNFRTNSPEEYTNLMNGAIGNALTNASIPEGTQLNLFATSGPEAFGDFLDSDAVTGMNLQDIGNLDVQYGLSNPDILSETAYGMPEVFEAVTESNTPQGMRAFAGMTPALGTAGKLTRLYSMLQPLLK